MEFKCLVIMHNLINDKTNNGKTVKSMLSKINPENLAQIYITKTNDTESICKNIFEISERNLLKKQLKIINFNSPARSTDNKNSDRDNLPKASLMSKFSRTSAFLSFRNYIWKNEKWNSVELEKWIKDFSPDIIFIVPGYIEGVMDLGAYFSKKYNIPLVTFVTDDYFSNTIKTIDPIKKKLYRNLYKKYKMLSESSQLHYVIGEKMMEKYDDIFSVKHIPVMNNVQIRNYDSVHTAKKNSKFIFAGNCGLNRYKVLLKLADTLEKLNKNFNYNLTLDIYTPLPIEKKIINKFEYYSSCNYKGSVFGNELLEVIDNADFVVHVESFDKKYRHILETAISTKIPEYMNSNREIIVVGPEYSASINYVDKYEMGIVISEQTTLDNLELFNEIIHNTELHKQHIENAKNVLKKNHSEIKNSTRILESFQNIISRTES